MTAERPDVAQYVLVVQMIQLDALMEGWYVPDAQDEQSDAEAAEYDPKAQEPETAERPIEAQ